MLANTKPVLAEENLNYIEENVLKVCEGNSNITILSFKGTGIPFQLKQVFKFRGIDRLIVWLDFDQTTISTLLLNSLEYLISNYEKELTPPSLSILKELINKIAITEAEYIGFLKYLISEEHKKLTIVMESFGDLYKPKFETQRTLALNISRLSLSYLSVIYLSSREFDDKDKTVLGELWGYFSANILWGKEFAFSNKSASIQLQDKDFTTAFKHKLEDFVYNDPTLYKYCEVRAQRDKAFQEDFVNTTDVKKLYKLIGEEWLDWRYKEIVMDLKLQTVEELKTKKLSTSEFCINTGLVSNGDNEIVFFHPLFEHFIKHRLDITLLKKSNKTINEYLTGQELKVFNLLVSKKDEVVSRDDIAKTMWDDDWNDKYSDWSIDKVISNIKKKLFENNETQTIKTFKGEGFQLLLA